MMEYLINKFTRYLWPNSLSFAHIVLRRKKLIPRDPIKFCLFINKRFTLMQFALHFKCLYIHVSRQSIKYTHTHTHVHSQAVANKYYGCAKKCATLFHRRELPAKSFIYKLLCLLFISLCMIYASFTRNLSKKNSRVGQSGEGLKWQVSRPPRIHSYTDIFIFIPFDT